MNDEEGVEVDDEVDEIVTGVEGAYIDDSAHCDTEEETQPPKPAAESEKPAPPEPESKTENSPPAPASPKGEKPKEQDKEASTAEAGGAD